MSKRSNHEGSIYEYKDKYRAVVTTPSGRRQYKLFDTRSEAAAWLSVQVVAIAGNRFIDNSKITVLTWLAAYIDEHARPRLRQRSYERLKGLVHHYSDIYGVPIQKLTNTHIQRVLNAMAATYAPNTIANAKNLIHAALKQAVINKLILHNPAEYLSIPKAKHQDITIITNDQLQKILDAANGHKWRLIIQIAAVTGMRWAEIAGLRVRDFHAVTSTINITQTLQCTEIGRIIGAPKTEKSKRKITVPADVSQQLQKYIVDQNRAFNKEQLIFQAVNHADAVDYRTFNRFWRRMCIKAGVPTARFHDLRHTHASILLAHGVPITDVSRRLGHSKVSVTLDVYGHVIDIEENAIMQVVEKIYLAK